MAVYWLRTIFLVGAERLLIKFLYGSKVWALLQKVDIGLVNWNEGGYTVTDHQGYRGEIAICEGLVVEDSYEMSEKTAETLTVRDATRWWILSAIFRSGLRFSG